MGIYFGETEITGMHFGEQEITEIFFGNTEIFSVWAEYDGTLPAQYSANGDHLADYRIYGAAGGVGDKTDNIYDYTANDPNNGYMQNFILKSDGTAQFTYGYSISEYIPLLAEAYYTLDYKSSLNIPALCFYDAQKHYISGIQYSSRNPITVESPANAAFCRFTVANSLIGATMLAPGSAAPESYVPYGYEVDMSVSDGTASTTTPIYFGDEPLGEDEYIDYKSGKVYRRTTNRFDPEAYSASGYLHEDGTIEDGAAIWRISDYIPVIGGQTYTLANVITSAPAYCWYNANKEYISGAKYNAGSSYANITATAPGNAAFIRASYAWDGILAEDADIFMVVDGSTAPAEYEPYVAPVDPPVPLPALPTVDGTTITDYAGQSTPPSSRFYAKYRKEGF